MINLNEIFLSSDISIIINDELNKCYEQLKDVEVSDMTTDQLLQYMQILYLIQLRKDPRGLSGLLGRSPDPSESPRTFARSASNW